MPHPCRRAALLGLAAAFAAPWPAQSQTGWPSRPITIIVPNPPGGGSDFAARLFQEPLTRALGQQVVIDNRPGASGNIAIQYVVRSPPDGYTLLLQYSGYHGGNPAMIRNLGWDPVRDLAPVGMATVAPHGIFTSPIVAARTLPEFIGWVRARPGQVNYASSGNGTIQHIAGALFARMIGVPMEHVPYRGAAPALQDVAGGRVELFITTPSSAIGLVQGGRVNALAIAGEARIPALPQVPTTAEAGLAGFVIDAWFGFFAPAGTSAAVVGRLNAVLRDAAALPEVRRRAEEGGVFLRPLTVAEMDRVARREVEVLGRIIRENNITID
jgi:tripartite-type tricarboxylate transporter receptor subunit TctC